MIKTSDQKNSLTIENICDAICEIDPDICQQIVDKLGEDDPVEEPEESNELAELLKS